VKMTDAVLLPEGGAAQRPVHGARGGSAFAGTDWLAEERPVALEFNGISHAVMLATPLDLEDFALGFALSEGIVDAPADVRGIEARHDARGTTVSLEIAARCMARLKERRRSLAGRTGCGLCGTESLEQVERALPPLPAPDAGAALARAALRRAMRELPALQALQQATGAVHAAGWCGPDGAVRLMREDVGRHNALDKLIGAMAASGIGESERARGFIAVTSRASFEMVHKVVAARVPVLAAVSAATTLAADLAQRLGLSLAGFVRHDNLVIYAGGERLAGGHHGS